MSSDYTGLTQNQWTGTWSPTTQTATPVVLDTDMRGGLQSILGTGSTTYLSAIPGTRLNQGMIVYLQTGYTNGGYTRAGQTYYTYSNPGASRDGSGALPNGEAYWSVASAAINTGGGAVNFLNVYSSNSVTTTNLVATGTLSYSEDIVKRGPYLTPSAANGGVIQAWISATCNASSQPTRSWWATSQTPSYGNASVVTAQYCSGGVFVPPNGVLFVPANSTSILTFYPDNGIYTTAQAPVGTSGNFAGGLLLPTGNVLFCPQNSNVGMYNPLSSIYSNSTALPGGAYSGVLTANNVIFAPQGTPSNVMNYNFTTGAISNVLALPSANVYGKSFTTAPTVVGTSWNGVAWSPQLGLFVVVGSATPYIAWSTDGKIWVQAPTVVGTSWNGVAWSPQLALFVAVGFAASSYQAYSPDGKTWTLAVTPVGGNWNSVAWSPQLGLFAATASVGGGIIYSADGKNWFGATINGGTSWNSVAWSPQLGLFVAVGGGATNYQGYSLDGKIWNSVPTPLTGTWRGICWSPQLGLLVVVGSATPYIAYSSGTGLQQGACLLTNGNVIVPSPGTANVIQFNPVTLAASNLIVGTDGFNGLTLAPNGNVIGTPMNSNIIVINPSNFTSSNLTVPSSNANTQTFYGGACLSATGNIIFAPSLTITANVGTSNVGMYDPVAGSFSNSTPTGAGFTGATLMPSGKIIFTPGSGSVNAGVYGLMNPIDSTFCASPYFNKS